MYTQSYFPTFISLHNFTVYKQAPSHITYTIDAAQQETEFFFFASGLLIG